MKLTRRAPEITPVSLVPLVDIMLILLVFFMVTSTYLDLDYLPAVPPATETALPPSPAAADRGDGLTLLVRLRADGAFVVRGNALNKGGLLLALKAHASAAPDAPVMVFPSGAAPVQSLIDAMEAADEADVAAIRVVRLEDGS